MTRNLTLSFGSTHRGNFPRGAVASRFPADYLEGLFGLTEGKGCDMVAGYREERGGLRGSARFTTGVCALPVHRSWFSRKPLFFVQ